MFNIIIIFSLLLLPNYMFTMSKAPKDPAPVIIPMIQLEFHNTQNSTIYYPIYPIIIQNTARNTINISPLISYTKLKGETLFQLLVSFSPIENYIHQAEHISISSPSRTITFPLVNKQLSYQKNIKKNTDYAHNIGYTQIFPEDITNLLLLILEPKEKPFYSWKPKESQQYISNVLSQNKALKPIFYPTNNLQHFYNLQQATKLPTALILESHIPFFVQEKRIAFTLHNKIETQQWYLSPYQLWTLIELLEIYNQLLKGFSFDR